MLEFSSVFPWWPGDGEDLEEVGDTLGKSDGQIVRKIMIEYTLRERG